jgi:putative hydrolase of HD superfamily
MKKRYVRENFLHCTEPVLTTLEQTLELKNLLRQGWLQNGIPENQCESVADHSFSTALCAWLIALQFYPQLDLQKVLAMALVHELGEIYAGDITPSQNMSAETKHELEYDSLRKVLGQFEQRQTLIDLWQEFETGTSPEASFVKQIDRFEMALQALQYAKLTGCNLDGFIKCTRHTLTDEKLKMLLEEMLVK